MVRVSGEYSKGAGSNLPSFFIFSFSHVVRGKNSDWMDNLKTKYQKILQY